MADAVVDLWVRDTAVGSPSRDDTDVLDEHERERLSRLVDVPSARAYAVLHVLARQQVGALLGRPPESLGFDRTCPDCGRQHGRPVLVDEPGVQVSLSRSGSVVALGLSRSGPLGVDVEHVSGAAFPGFGQVALHPSERDGAVDGATAWVRKEACLKALGVGLRVEPASFVTPRAGEPTQVVPGMPSVTVVDVDAPPGCAAAVALGSEVGRFEVHHH
ncbi:hypothetical protein GCM10009868_38470 [Terrabacter aerolatus]|uniref:4'-phosphopantetheinyl transferase domain-containing protein n=1 Tax=Terrabacter aerolatus TaxID=422442 RepID=A0A512D175_9MICO|nr:4'-phosphopantetheinyl transferase superfamily protein [Terrabacter aerolatus]GEO30020.1 hypothetical protein TAE01_18300 [Terrabacter aerolatus]